MPTFDSASSAAGTGSATFSHTVANQANRVLVVDVLTVNVNISSVVFNSSETLTLDRRRLHAGGFPLAERWYYIGPTVTTANIVVTGNAGDVVIGAGRTYYDVDQTTPITNGTSAEGSSTTPSLTVSSAAGNLVIDMVGAIAGSGTVGAGQTERFDLASGGGVDMGSEEAGAASVSMDWTLNTSGNWVQLGGSLLAPATGWGLLLGSHRNRMVA